MGIKRQNPAIQTTLRTLGFGNLGFWGEGGKMYQWWLLHGTDLKVGLGADRPLDDGEIETQLTCSTGKVAYIRSDDPPELVEQEVLRICT